MREKLAMTTFSGSDGKSSPVVHGVGAALLLLTAPRQGELEGGRNDLWQRTQNCLHAWNYSWHRQRQLLRIGYIFC